MTPVVSPDSAQSASPDRSRSIWIRLFFEDDQDLWRMLIVSFGSTRISQAVSQRLRFGIAVTIFLIVLGLLFQVVDSQETRAGSETGVAKELSGVSALPEATQSAAQPLDSTGNLPGWTPLAGSGVDDQNFTFGSIDSAASKQVDGASPSPRLGPLVSKNGSAAARGASMAGFGGGGPGSAPDRAVASQETPVQVPETGSSAALLGLALFAVVGLGLFVKRRSAPQSGFR